MATINGTSGNDTLNGTSSADTINGLGGNDILNGNNGDDTLVGGAGADQLNGGNGWDWASYAGATSGLVIDLNTGALSTGDAAGDTYSGIESYVGSSHSDTFIAGMTGTTFDGGGGSDDAVDYSAATAGVVLSLTYSGSVVQGGIYGGAGLADNDGFWNIDRIIGTAYNDVYTLDAGSATRFTVTEGVGGGTDELRTTATSYTLGANIEILTYTGTSSFTGTGNALANTITGGNGDDSLWGGGGADTLIGGSGWDWARYASATGLVIDLDTGALSTGDAAGDIYSGIECFVGSSSSDTFIAGMTGTTFDGGGGSDDVVDYSAATAGVVLSLTYSSSVVQGGIYGGGGLADNDGFWNIDRIIGTAYNDVYTLDAGSATRFTVTEGVGGGTDELRTSATSYTLGANLEILTYTGASAFTGTGNALANTLNGAGGNDVLIGGSGADTLNGGGGTDLASYATSGSAITFDVANAASTGDAAGDSYSSIEGLRGTGYADLYYAGAESFFFDGSGGRDQVSYAHSGTGVTLDITTGVGTGIASGDTFSSVEEFVGSDYADSFTGSTAAETFFGGLGADTINGGGGIDAVSYQDSASGVTAYLSNGGTSTGGTAAGDVLTNVENLYGSDFDDVLTGDGAANYINGEDGIDLIYGGGGDDEIVIEGGSAYGGTGDDLLRSYAFSDPAYLYGGDGEDSLKMVWDGHAYGGEDGDEYYLDAMTTDTAYIQDDGTTGTDSIWLPFDFSSASTLRVGDDLYLSGSGYDVVLEDWFNGYATIENFVSSNSVLFHINSSGTIYI